MAHYNTYHDCQAKQSNTAYPWMLLTVSLHSWSSITALNLHKMPKVQTLSTINTTLCCVNVSIFDTVTKKYKSKVHPH